MTLNFDLSKVNSEIWKFVPDFMNVKRWIESFFKIIKALDEIGLLILEVRDVTCRVGSHCYPQLDTSEHAPSQPVSWYSIYLPRRDEGLS